MLDCPNDFHVENDSFSAFKKMVLRFLQVIAVKEQYLNFSNDSMLFLINFRDKKKSVTDRQTDRQPDGRTNERTEPHIEMRGRI